MLLSSYGQSEVLFELAERCTVDTATLGNFAKVLDPKDTIEGLDDFEYRIVKGYEPPQLHLCTGVAQMPNDSLLVTVPEVIPQEYRPYFAGMHLLNSVTGDPVEVIIANINRNLKGDSSHTLSYIAFLSLRQAYLQLKRADPLDLKRQTGMELRNIVLAHRVGSGFSLERTKPSNVLRSKMFNNGILELPNLGLKLVLGERANTPKQVSNDEEILGVSLTTEPKKPSKYHICKSCETAIMPKSVRITTTVPRNGYDHHHYHAICANEVFSSEV